MKATHRHTTHGHEHEFEPQRGLPEPLPAGESLLWQGSPEWRLLARRAFHVRKLVAYFGVLLVLRAGFAYSDGATPLEAARSTLGPAVLAGIALALVLLMAWLSARGAVYTITDKRVVMRIGIVLTLTFNIPYKRIAAAGLHLDTGGAGDLPLTLLGSDRIAWLHLWPHARPWRLGKPEPMLRCVPQAAGVARLLTEAWSQATGVAAASAVRPAPVPNDPGHGQPALARG
ncbi:MAG: photosynthetic complex putative assembly protein PuhB [Rubrivivax sp.]|nr:photosynthetic complex putative assembly protein PuhB [Rubrivivax sp.]